MPRCRLATLLAIAIGFATIGSASIASAQSGSSAKPAYPAESDLIEVMFAPDSRVRLRGGVLVDLTTNALDGVDAALRNAGRTEWSRIADVPEQTLDDLQVRGAANIGGDLYNLNNIYRLRFETADVWTLSAELEALPGVMSARPVPLPMPAPLPPDFQPSQNYEDPASANPTGVDAEYAWTQPGGTGVGVTVCDLEYSWNYNHDDVTKAFNSQINTNVADPFLDTNHGTAVVGELVSDNNGWGTQGVCYGSSLKTCGTYYGTPTPAWNVPGALAVTIAALNPGDVILMEQQWDYTGGAGYVPIEWWTDVSPNPQTTNAVYVAIANAVANGIHVVEAGGNGSVDTDVMIWKPDNGAIIVGAGGAYFGGTWAEGNLERLSFSSYGSRFHLQGWGEDVVTTGYSDLFAAEGFNRWYTSMFSGTSSASPIVTGAVACVQGYYLANISATPLSPTAMRTLLIQTGTPQSFGLVGNIGPRPDCFAAIQSLQPQLQAFEYGDAPEGAFAYPSLGVIGQFPTCFMTGPPGSYIRHSQIPLPAFLGPSLDYELDGNAGNCPNFPPYDADECWNDGDAGLIMPPAYTIDSTLVIVPCDSTQNGCLGEVCTMAQWGVDVDVSVTNPGPNTLTLNLLMDWDQSGFWTGASSCPTGPPAQEHVLVNFSIPPGFSGPVSTLGPPGFLIGPQAGFVWSRFTLSDAFMPNGWDGSGDFVFGETSDYLLCIEAQRFEYGDAPEGATAYPWLGVIGQFPTCTTTGPAGFISHASTGQLYFGPSVDREVDGNAGNCPNFPPYDADECWADGDAGLLFPQSFTINPAITIVPCPSGSGSSLGSACQMATWGTNIDITVTNFTGATAYANAIMDWNQNGAWALAGSPSCPGGGGAPERVLINLSVPSGFSGPLSALAPPAFRIGPNDGYVWCRFTISDVVIPLIWTGAGTYQDGETCDYLLRIDANLTGVDGPDAAIAATRLLPSQPNPFNGRTSIRFELDRPGAVSVEIYDVAGRRIRGLVDETRSAGRYAVPWDGLDESGERVSAGRYFVRMRAAGQTFSAPVTHVR